MNDYVDQLLHCPVGCAFLLAIQRAGVAVGRVVQPQQAFARAAAALRALNPWSPSFGNAVYRAVGAGAELRDLAERVVQHPNARWWTAPFNRARQMLVEEETGPIPIPNPSWEAYAQRPVGWQLTSTLHGDVSCADAIIAAGIGDWGQTGTTRRRVLVPATTAAAEINGPADWHDLCARFPRTEEAASPEEGGFLTPDWRLLAAQYGGVHLTFMGLLTAPFVRVSTSAGTVSVS